MLGVWVLTKLFQAPHDGNDYPIAWSYGYNHAAMGYQDNGWGLSWVSMDIHQFAFLKAGMDPNVQVVGKNRDEATTPFLLETYKDKLGEGAFSTLGQVLDKLGEWEPRFWLERDPHKP
jgi:hypothetical protein